MSDLPYIDEHRIAIAAPRDVVWIALCRYADASIGLPAGNPLAKLLGAEPARGFAVIETRAQQRLALGGRHRFSRYELIFDLADLPDGRTRVSARSYGEFPGLLGVAYRTLVIGSGGHVRSVRHMLHGVSRRSLDPTGR